MGLFLDEMAENAKIRVCAYCGHRFNGASARYGKLEFCSNNCMRAYRDRDQAGERAAQEAAAAAEAAKKLAAQQREDAEKDHFRPEIEKRVGHSLKLSDITHNPRTEKYVAQEELEAEQEDARECFLRAWGVPASVVTGRYSWDEKNKQWYFDSSYGYRTSSPSSLVLAIAACLKKPVQELTKDEIDRFEKVEKGLLRDKEFPSRVVKIDTSKIPAYTWQPGDADKNAAAHKAIAEAIAEAVSPYGYTCAKCGAYVKPGKKFCHKCGTSVMDRTVDLPPRKKAPAPKAAAPAAAPSAAVCSQCGAELEAGTKFCVSCGTPAEAAPAVCPQCGAALKPGAKFCGGGGAKAGK